MKLYIALFIHNLIATLELLESLFKDDDADAILIKRCKVFIDALSYYSHQRLNDERRKEVNYEIKRLTEILKKKSNNE